MHVKTMHGGREGDADVGRYGLKPYVDTAPQNVVPLLILDSHDEFSCQCDPGPWD